MDDLDQRVSLKLSCVALRPVRVSERPWGWVLASLGIGPRLIRRPVKEARKSVEQSVRLFPTTMCTLETKQLFMTSHRVYSVLGPVLRSKGSD